MDWKHQAKENSMYGFAKAQALRAKRVASGEGAPLTEQEIEEFQERQRETRRRLKKLGIDVDDLSFRAIGRVIF